MKTFVVGDVHGRRAQLQRLLEIIPRDESSDMLVFLGDLIDRGPDAPGCVDLVMKLQRDNPRASTLPAWEPRADAAGFYRRQREPLDYARHRR